MFEDLINWTKLAKEILAANLEDMLYAYTPDTAPLKVIKTGMLTNEAIAELIDQMPKINEYKSEVDCRSCHD